MASMALYAVHLHLAGQQHALPIFTIISDHFHPYGALGSKLHKYMIAEMPILIFVCTL